MPKLGSSRFCGVRPAGGHEGQLKCDQKPDRQASKSELIKQQLQKAAGLFGVELDEPSLVAAAAKLAPKEPAQGPAKCAVALPSGTRMRTVRGCPVELRKKKKYTRPT